MDVFGSDFGDGLVPAQQKKAGTSNKSEFVEAVSNYCTKRQPSLFAEPFIVVANCNLNKIMH